MIKLLLRVNLSGIQPDQVSLIQIEKVVFWPVCPRIGETVSLGTSFSGYHDVKVVVHEFAIEEVVIEIEMTDPADMAELLNEEGGGWKDTSTS